MSNCIKELSFKKIYSTLALKNIYIFNHNAKGGKFGQALIIVFFFWLNSHIENSELKIIHCFSFLVTGFTQQNAETVSAPKRFANVFHLWLVNLSDYQLFRY